MVEVEGFSSENSLPLGDRNPARGLGGDPDLEFAPWNILVVGCKALAGLDAAG